MKVNGLMINPTEKAFKFSKVAPNIPVNLRTVQKTDMVSINGKMGKFTKDYGKMINLMGRGISFGVMVDRIVGCGKMIKKMGKENLNMKMGVFSKEISLKT